MNSKKTFEKEAANRVLSHWNVNAPEDRLAHLVKDTSKAFDRQLQQRLADRDIPIGYWNYLRILWKKEGLTKKEISIEAGVMEPSAFVALKAMEEAGFIYFEKKEENKKNVYVFLTEKGRQLETQLIPLAIDVNALAAEGVTAAELSTTRKVLLKMLVNLSTQPEN